MKKITILFGLSLFIVLQACSQTDPSWNGKKAAVVITYDDAIDQHLDNALPLLDSLGLKATFYITGFSASMRARLSEWKTVAAKGHELGNHSLYHPCAGGKGREWVHPDYDLNRYTVHRMADELKVNNLLLQSMDGKTSRTFAFPCGDTKAGDSSYVNAIRGDFVALRSVRNEMHQLPDIDLSDLDCYMVNGESGEQLINWVKKAVQSNSLLIILFHGVGGGNNLNVSLAAHRQFLQYIRQQEKDIWVAPMVEVAEFIKANQHTRNE